MKSIIVNVMPEETRAAVVEDGELREMFAERTAFAHLVGNIYKGRVQNVLPGMQAAFVDVGGEKNAFLYIGDGLPKQAAQAVQAENFHAGQNVVIQIVKDAIGTKGPRATTHITLPGRSVVLMPTVDYIGISHRLGTAAERERLREIAGRICPSGMGMIVRTAAAGQSEAALQKDVQYLEKLWHSLLARSKVSHSPTLLYRDADLIIRLVRDDFTPEVDELIVDQPEAHARICELSRYLSPELAARVRLYRGEEDIFRAHRLTEAIESIGKREIALKSGGFLVIDKTEALTVIDVNTGKFVGATNLSDTVFQANLEAAAEITRQIRLRDIGGIIIVDFIDMDTEEQKQRVLHFLTEAVRDDKTKTNIVDITPLGLVEITRKKSRQNFEGMVYSSCPCCGGRGMVEAPETVAIRIGRELRRRERKQRAARGYTVQVHPRTAEAFVQTNWAALLERELACRIRIEKDAAMHPEAYAILSPGEA